MLLKIKVLFLFLMLDFVVLCSTEEVIRESYFITDIFRKSKQTTNCWDGIQYAGSDGKCRLCLGYGETCNSDMECCAGYMSCKFNNVSGTNSCTCNQGMYPDFFNSMCTKYFPCNYDSTVQSQSSSRMFHMALGLGAGFVFIVFALIAHFCKKRPGKETYYMPTNVKDVSPTQVFTISSRRADIPRVLNPSAPPLEEPPPYTEIYPILHDPEEIYPDKNILKNKAAV